MELELLKLSVLVMGVFLAITYIKALNREYSKADTDAIKKEANGALEQFSKKVWLAMIFVIQGFRLALVLGFVIGAMILLDGWFRVIPLLLVLTDAVFVTETAWRMIKTVKEGTIHEMVERKKVHYFLNLALVGVTIGCLL